MLLDGVYSLAKVTTVHLAVKVLPGYSCYSIRLICCEWN